MLIGEVARRCGVSARMLRHYDVIGLVRPTGHTSGGYRDYSDEDIRRLFRVEGLRTLGLSLEQVASALDNPDFTPEQLIGDLIHWAQVRIARERELLTRLHAVDASAPTDWQDVLRTVELLRDLSAPNPARRQQTNLAAPGEAPIPTAVLVEALASEDDPHVAGALQWALAKVGAKGVSDLARAAGSTDPRVRQHAVVAVTKLPESPEATAVLAVALGDSDTMARERAALALGQRGTETAWPALVGMVVGGSHDVEAADALAVLCRDPHLDAVIVPALTGELDAAGADPSVRMRLAQALGEIGTSAARKALEGLTHDEDRMIALAASALLTAHES